MLPALILTACPKDKKADKTNQPPLQEKTIEDFIFNDAPRNDIPQSAQSTIGKLPNDVLAGFGTAKMANMSMSRTTAQTRARADIFRQVEKSSLDMINAYAAKNNYTPPGTLASDVNQAWSNVVFTGLTVVDEDMEDDGSYWAVVTFSKTMAEDAAKEVVKTIKQTLPEMDFLPNY
jgi:hypothetical protein